MKAVRSNEKFFFVLGGFIGFCLVFFTNVACNVQTDRALRNALIGALIAALATRFFLHIFYKNIRAAIEEKNKVQEFSDDKTGDGP